MSAAALVLLLLLLLLLLLFLPLWLWLLPPRPNGRPVHLIAVGAGWKMKFKHKKKTKIKETGQTLKQENSRTRSGNSVKLGNCDDITEFPFRSQSFIGTSRAHLDNALLCWLFFLLFNPSPLSSVLISISFAVATFLPNLHIKIPLENGKSFVGLSFRVS